MSAPACRICWGGEQPLLRPCGCKGTMAWAHATCVDDWRRALRGRTQHSHTCGLCRRQYTARRRHLLWLCDIARLRLEAGLLRDSQTGCVLVGAAMHFIEMLTVLVMAWSITAMIHVVLCLVVGDVNVCRE
jgi:hypothetical protein